MAMVYLVMRDSEQALKYFNMAKEKNEGLAESEQFKDYKVLQQIADSS
jgi:hypothetical protein